MNILPLISLNTDSYSKLLGLFLSNCGDEVSNWDNMEKLPLPHDMVTFLHK